MKILKMLRLILVAIMIGFSCIMPDAHSDVSTKYLIEQKDTEDDEPEEKLIFIGTKFTKIRT